MLTQDETNELGLSREPEECESTAIKFVNLPIVDRSVPWMEMISCAQLNGLPKW